MLAVLLTASARDRTFAQINRPLTADDSVQVHLAVLRALFDSLRVDTSRTARIWVLPTAHWDSVTRTSTDVALSDRELAAIEAVYPRARGAPAYDSVFVCAPGVRARMPGRGCPIRDDGIVVRFRTIRVSGDTARMAAGVIRSESGASGVYTWQEGFDWIVLVYTRGTWDLRAMLARWIT